MEEGVLIIGCVLVCVWIIDNIPGAVVVDVDEIFPIIKVFYVVYLMGAVAVEHVIDAVAIGIDKISEGGYIVDVDGDTVLDERGGRVVRILCVSLDGVKSVGVPLMCYGYGLSAGMIRGGVGVVVIPDDDEADSVSICICCDEDEVVGGVDMSGGGSVDGGAAGWVVSFRDIRFGDIGV